jgi:hypothetical protein
MACRQSQSLHTPLVFAIEAASLQTKKITASALIGNSKLEIGNLLN